MLVTKVQALSQKEYYFPIGLGRYCAPRDEQSRFYYSFLSIYNIGSHG